MFLFDWSNGSKFGHRKTLTEKVEREKFPEAEAVEDKSIERGFTVNFYWTL